MKKNSDLKAEYNKYCENKKQLCQDYGIDAPPLTYEVWLEETLIAIHQRLESLKEMTRQYINGHNELSFHEYENLYGELLLLTREEKEHEER